MNSYLNELYGVNDNVPLTATDFDCRFFTSRIYELRAAVRRQVDSVRKTRKAVGQCRDFGVVYMGRNLIRRETALLNELWQQYRQAQLDQREVTDQYVTALKG